MQAEPAHHSASRTPIARPLRVLTPALSDWSAQR